MPRKTKPEQLTPLELEIMKVLWETGPANVQTVQERLAGSRDLAYTTVQTMLNVLHKKGRVRRELRDRAYFYAAEVSERRAASEMLGDLLDRLFGGSAEKLVLSLVEQEKIGSEELKRIERLLNQRKEDGDAAR